MCFHGPVHVAGADHGNFQVGHKHVFSLGVSPQTLRPEPGDVLGEAVGQADAGLSVVVQLLDVAEPVDHQARPEPAATTKI